ncbi:EF-P 5-aminopentanol modification-associated protein YfmF [Pseudoflavonifractor sp. MSJ-37]|uniref:EF-P 5-aminopentanol modification-associated protein YfmF n=1 Tax=Pseudoflavonifractor sp. MSJ-37 TaxID=2841531 RepID=UPI001C12906E|nr:insulinase family protein [Pseudoflavonifractor sp. MSJ-37]MBU5434875.1 insulinase family protein [Pseudoflavonifractor sp. MSJ-37]
MAETTRISLFPGVFLTAVHTKKFRSCVLGASFLAPLDRETASLNALVPYVLRRGTADRPDMESLSAALDELYGGSIEPVVRTRGEIQCVGFLGSFLDDAYTLDGSAVLEDAAALLGELLLHPRTVSGSFDPDYTASERSNLVDRIRAQVNDKRSYALLRLKREMCAGEPFGVDRLGDEASAIAIGPAALWERYQTLLHTAPLELYYCGSADPERAADALRTALAALPVSERRDSLPRPTAQTAPDQPRLVEEAMDVGQGKLALGFRTGIDAWDPRFPALLLANAIYGGTTTSKLFLNVREKRSLCYYASSQLARYKGLMLVSSGVEFDQFQAARDEILAQLDACRAGQFDDQELEAARRSVVSSLISAADAQGRLEDFWLGQSVAGIPDGPDALAAKAEAVRRDQILEAFAALQLDTIYFLKSKEA